MLDDTLRRPEHQLDTPAVECVAGVADLPAKLGRKAVPIAACRSYGDSLGRAIMGLLDRFRSNRGLSLAGAPPLVPLWSPGELGLTVVGEAYHEDACARAEQSAATGAQLVGVLAPDPGNSYDQNAVAVYVQSELVGWVPREIAGVLQRALTSRLASYGSRLAGRAEVTTGASGPRIVVWIDPTPLGLADDQ